MCKTKIKHDTKVLQCDRCCGDEAWKCIKCLNLAADIYDIPISDSSIDLKWFCVNCEKEVMSSKFSTYQDATCRMEEMMSQIHSLPEKTDNLGRLLEEQVESTAGKLMQERVDAKVDHIEQMTNNKLEKLGKVIDGLQAAISSKVETHDTEELEVVEERVLQLV
jgi:hypothetical protein